MYPFQWVSTNHFLAQCLVLKKKKKNAKPDVFLVLKLESSFPFPHNLILYITCLFQLGEAKKAPSKIRTWNKISWHRRSNISPFCGILSSPQEELSTNTSRHSRPAPNIPSFGDPNQLCALATNATGKGRWRALLKKSSPNSKHPKVKRDWSTGAKIKLGVGVESSLKNFSPPPQTTGIPRRPPVTNFSPPPKQPEYFAAPLLEIPRPLFSEKNAENPGGLSLESFSGPWYGRS